MTKGEKRPNRSVYYLETGEWMGFSRLEHAKTACEPPTHVWYLGEEEQLVDKPCLCGEYIGANCPTCRRHWKIVPCVPPGQLPLVRGETGVASATNS